MVQLLLIMSKGDGQSKLERTIELDEGFFSNGTIEVHKAGSHETWQARSEEEKGFDHGGESIGGIPKKK